MAKNHLSRLAAPKRWPILRKSTKWIVRPAPGPHSLNESIPLAVLFRDILNYVKTSKEIQKVLNDKNILVDKVVRTSHNFPVGLMDVIEIPSVEEYYRVVYDEKGRFFVISIKKDQAKLKLLKVIRKNIVKGSKIQATFHDGRNLLLGKSECSVGDSILFDLEKKSISKLLPLEKNSLVYINDGNYTGKTGKVKEILSTKGLQKKRIIVEIDNKDYTTLAEYVFVIGKDKAEIDLGIKK